MLGLPDDLSLPRADEFRWASLVPDWSDAQIVERLELCERRHEQLAQRARELGDRPERIYVRHLLELNAQVIAPVFFEWRTRHLKLPAAFEEPALEELDAMDELEGSQLSERLAACTQRQVTLEHLVEREGDARLRVYLLHLIELNRRIIAQLAASRQNL